MENVLRAMDVIPPFGSHSAPDRPSLKHVPDSSPVPISAIKGPHPSQSIQDVPKLDLGEKILAEQRRRTARKRRAPGARDVVEDIDRAREDAPKQRPVEPASDELAQLQEIVADIVARDIKRLCVGLQHA